MKVKNLRNRSMIIGGRPVEPGRTITMDDEKLVEIQSLLDEGLIEIQKIKLKEGNYGKTIRG